MTTVSVIIPVYNTEKYLKKCLDSVMQQTLQNMEIVIVNDGSTDGSAAIIKEYALRYKNIKTVTQSNQGLYNARQAGLKETTGEYIGWVDSDDFVDKTMFEKLYNAAIANHSELAYCNYQFYPQKIKTKETWFRKYNGKVAVEFIERNSQPWNKIVKRRLLTKLNIGELFVHCFDEAYIKVLLYAENPVALAEPLYFYRMRQESLSSSYKNVQHYIEFIRASTCLKNEMEKFYADNPYWRAYFEYREIYYTIQSMLVAAHAKDKLIYKSLKKELKAYPYAYYKNIHMWSILKENFGILKAFALKWLVALNYSTARLLSKLAFY